MARAVFVARDNQEKGRIVKVKGTTQRPHASLTSPDVSQGVTAQWAVQQAGMRERQLSETATDRFGPKHVVGLIAAFAFHWGRISLKVAPRRRVVVSFAAGCDSMKVPSRIFSS